MTEGRIWQKVVDRKLKVVGTVERVTSAVHLKVTLKAVWREFPGGPVVKNPPANVGDTDSTLALGRLHMPQSN